MKRIISYSLLLYGLFGCSSSEYQVMDPVPTLAISLQEADCQVGKTISVMLAISQEGVKEGFELSTTIQHGTASITLNDDPIETAGQWVALSGTDARITLSPREAGELIVSFQAKAPDGKTSEVRELHVTVSPESQISTKVICDERIVNPGVDKIPVTLQINGTVQQYTVIPSLSLGTGKIYYNGHVVNNTECSVENETIFYYDPDVIGEHILEFDITTTEATTMARTYMNVVKNISVKSPIDGCFTIKGAGEHDIEGETVTLELENEDLFNFEVAGWYDNNGKLLSEDASYPIQMTRDCMTDFEVKLKTRTVNITRTGIATIEFTYITQENGSPVPKKAYDYRVQYIGDYKASEPITFYYEEYKLNTQNYPPVGVKAQKKPEIPKGATRSTYLWRCDKSFTVYLREEDNPGFKFNYTKKYIESATTRYYIPTEFSTRSSTQKPGSPGDYKYFCLTP